MPLTSLGWHPTSEQSPHAGPRLTLRSNLIRIKAKRCLRCYHSSMEILFAFCLSATARGALLNPSFTPHTEMQCIQTATWLECESLALAAVDANAKASQPVFDIAFCTEIRREQEEPVRQEAYINTQWPKAPGWY